ncbi:hypothetical protein DSM104299_04915 [Baekduia alba]|uniref:hypothetical protein n=1 Tax=Baekduia alba TaxID=2997333 RepID=UPI00233FEF74|nr:hypothetical protein [Baekduia alba]WCB96159.1 hypothetical protein DSM104299_04915 [Baekduia alba]
MHRLAVLLALVVVAAAVPAAAPAKGLTSLVICGADGCVDRSAALRADSRLMRDLMSYDATVADPGPAPHLRLEEGIGDAGKTYGHTTVTYYPTLGIQSSSEATFHRTTPEVRGHLARLARGVRPWGVPAAAPVRATAARDGGRDDGGGIPTGTWLAGAAAALLLAAGGVALVRRGRPATG